MVLFRLWVSFSCFGSFRACFGDFSSIIERDEKAAKRGRKANTSRCGGTVYALVSKTSPARVEGSNLSIGTSRIWRPPMSSAPSTGQSNVRCHPPESTVVYWFYCQFCSRRRLGGYCVQVR